MLNSMRCVKCGLTQLAAPTCQNCGKATGISEDARSVRTVGLAAPPTRAAASTPPITHAAPSDATDAEPTVSEPTFSKATLSEPTVVHRAAETDGDRTELIGDPTERLDTDTERRLTFAGGAGTLLGIHIVNMLLTVLTLGIYYCWAKVRVRSYLLSETVFEGDRFAYHGTGRELFIGTLKGGLLFGVVSALFQAAPALPGGAAVKVSAFLVGYIGLLLLIPVATVGARRYRLSRTSWRNIRFSFQGKVGEFIKLFVGGTLLTGLTLGLYYPFFATKRQGFLVSHSRFGNRAFGFDGRGRDLFGPFLIAMLLTIPTLGLVWLWYWARRTRYYWGHTSFETARFVSTMTGRGLFGLHIVNLVLLLLTFGLAWPLVTIRNLRFEFANLRLVGALETDSAQQDTEAVATKATGDGLGDFLEVDTGFAA
ncbi:MAG: DUF898 family protein [Nitrospirota bacterium]